MITDLVQRYIQRLPRTFTTSRPTHTRRSGFTLVEMMVSVTLALLMILAVVQVFEWMGDSVAYGRATIEMSGELQTATSQLQRDLDNRTCDVKPWIKPGEGAGYFYYRELDLIRVETENFKIQRGADEIRLTNDAASLSVSSSSNTNVDISPNENFFLANSHYGDLDDVIAFTVRSPGKPFSGVDGVGNFVESTLAEVTYLVHNSGTVGSPIINLYRKIRLIVPASFDPDITDAIPSPSGYVAGGDIATAVNLADPSLPGRPLSLEDLTEPQYRFYTRLNDPTPIPSTPATTVAAVAFNEMVRPENLILQDVLAFDVRAFDPTAPIFNLEGMALSPGDLGYAAALGEPVLGTGAFVDLGYASLPTLSALSGAPHRLSLTMPGTTDLDVAYNTLPWKLLMHVDPTLGSPAVDGKDSPDVADADNDGDTTEFINGIDDVGERLIQPPYDTPLRGIEVTLRMWDVQMGQVMQSSVVGDFVPK